jgi:hypothetical protein
LFINVFALFLVLVFRISLHSPERGAKREEEGDQEAGGLERFFSLQATLPRLFLGRILPKKAASFQNLTGSRKPLKAT